MKPLKTGISFAVILLLLVGVATWDDWQTKKDEVVKKESKKITSLTEAQITSFELKINPNRSTEGSEDVKNTTEPMLAKFEKVNGSWFVTEPVAAKADQNSVSTMIKAVLNYSYDEKLEDSQKQWSEYGVDENAERILTLNAQVAQEGDTKATTQSFTVYVGVETSVGYSAYVRTSKDSTVYVGSQHIRTGTRKQLIDLRDKSITQFAASDIHSIGHKSKQEEIVLDSTGANEWEMTSPAGYKLDQGEVNAWLGTVGSLKAKNFMDAPVSKEINNLFEAENLWLTLSWQKSQKDSDLESSSSVASKTIKLMLTKKDGKVLAAFDPSKVVFELEKDVSDQIYRSVFSLRDHKIVNFTESEVTKLGIDGLNFEKLEETWFPSAKISKAREVLAKKATPEDSKGSQGDLDEIGSSQSDELEHLGDGRPRSLLVDLEYAKTIEFVDPGDSQVAEDLVKSPFHRLTLLVDSPKEDNTGNVHHGGAAHGDLGPTEVEIKAFSVSEDPANFYVQVSTKMETIFKVNRSVFETFAPIKSNEKSDLSLPEMGLDLDADQKG